MNNWSDTKEECYQDFKKRLIEFANDWSQSGVGLNFHWLAKLIKENQDRLIRGLDKAQTRITANEKSLSWIWGAVKGLGGVSLLIGVIWGLMRIVG